MLIFPPSTLSFFPGADAATAVNNTRLGKQGCMLWDRKKRRMAKVQAEVTSNQVGIQPPGKASRCGVRNRSKIGEISRDSSCQKGKDRKRRALKIEIFPERLPPLWLQYFEVNLFIILHLAVLSFSSHWQQVSIALFFIFTLSKCEKHSSFQETCLLLMF